MTGKTAGTAYTLLLLGIQKYFFLYFRCGIVSLWMAGQFLDPSNEKDVTDIQDKAIEMRFTKHGEMFSAKNMAKLATTVFKCEAEKVKGSHEILRASLIRSR